MKPIDRPFCQNSENCTAIRRTRHCKPCGYLERSAEKKAKSPPPTRSHCTMPGQCMAKSKGHCKSCAKRKMFAERPHILAAHIERSRARIVALNVDPAHRAKVKAGQQGIFSRRHGVPQEMFPVTRYIARKMNFSVAEAAAIVRRDLVKGA